MFDLCNCILLNCKRYTCRFTYLIIRTTINYTQYSGQWLKIMHFFSKFGIISMDSNYFNCLMFIFMLIGSARQKWHTLMYDKQCSASFFGDVYRKEIHFFNLKKLVITDTAQTINAAGWPRQGVIPGHLFTCVLKPRNRSYTLHNTCYGIREQYSASIDRRRMYHRSYGDDMRMVQDKLYVNGQRYDLETEPTEGLKYSKKSRGACTTERLYGQWYI